MRCAAGGFARWVICQATYQYATAWHSGQWSDLYARLGRLSNLGYRPSPIMESWPTKKTSGEDDDVRALLAAWLWRDKPWRRGSREFVPARKLVDV